MAKYQPPTRVVTCQTPYLALVSQADRQWARDKYWAPEYEFGNRTSYANPYQRSPFNRLSSVYPVGAQQGGLDPLIQAALAPTVGNEVPGLYEGVETGSWA